MRDNIDYEPEGFLEPGDPGTILSEPVYGDGREWSPVSSRPMADFPGQSIIEMERVPRCRVGLRCRGIRHIGHLLRKAVRR